MVKPSAKLSSFKGGKGALVASHLALLVFVGCNCSGSRTRSSDQDPATLASRALPALPAHPFLTDAASSGFSAKKLWTQAVPGLMTDLAISRDGSAAILATVPNPDAVEGLREPGHGLTRFDRAGKRLWHIELEATVKSVALSDDGALAYVSTYDNTVLGIDKRGKTVWKLDGLCRPIAVGKRFLCYHDDDAEPGIAFDVYSDQGRKVLYYPISRDVLALKVSDDGRYTAIALEGGQLTLFGPEFKTVWQRKVSGEILDLAISSGDHPKVWALFNGPDASKSAYPGQSVAVFDEEGKLVAEAKPSARLEQIEAAPGGEGLGGYGNGAQGQFVDFFHSPRVGALAEKWYRSDRHAADFSSSLIAARDSFIFGYEDTAGGDRRSHLVALDFAGGVKWDLPLVTEDGAYVYAHGYAPGPGVVAVGTDDGFVSEFLVGKKP